MSVSFGRAALIALIAVGCGPVSQTGTEPPVAPTQDASMTPDPHAIPWRIGNGLTACGLVRAYTPATAADPGSLRIGSRTFTIAPGTPAAGSSGFRPSADTAMCIWGGLDGSGAASPNADPLEQYRCGRVRDYRAATASVAGHVKTLDYWSDGEADFVVPAGISLGTLHYDDYRCFTLAVDAAGDASAVGRDERQADVDLACGRVAAYAPATAASSGTIRIGSKIFTIPAGVSYRKDPAGAGTDPIAVGQITCLGALLDDTGAIARYGPVPTYAAPDAAGLLGGGTCGRVVAFKAPTATADGYVALSIHSVALRIPAGSVLTPLAASYQRCYDLSLDAAGDMIAVRDKDQARVGL